MFLFAYNLQEPYLVEFSLLWYFLSKLEKLRYKYYNVIAIYMLNQPYHEIQDIEIYQISKFLKNQI